MGFRTWLYKKIGVNFESLGNNCEFGLFLYKLGVDKSSFFRYTGIVSYKEIIELINGDFSDVFLLENLVSTQPEMVADKKFGINFHSNFDKYKLNEDTTKYNKDLKTKYINELSKIRYLSNKFLKNLKENNPIYVIKKGNEFQKSNINEIYELMSLLNSKGKCHVLYVTVTDNPKEYFKVKKLKNNIFIGYMDRFAPYSNAHDFNFYGWRKLIYNAYIKIIFYRFKNYIMPRRIKK